MKVIKPTAAAILDVSSWLDGNNVVAAPTETAYGLLAKARSNNAVNKVLKIKGRSQKQPIALLVSDMQMAKQFGHFSGVAKKLANKYWPGPLTIVVPAKSGLAKAVGASGYVGMRVPKHRWLCALIKKLNYPLTATSANISGKKNLYNSSQVSRQLKKSGLKFLVDGGSLPKRQTSTVVKVIGKQILIIRAGAVKLPKNFL